MNDSRALIDALSSHPGHEFYMKLTGPCDTQKHPLTDSFVEAEGVYPGDEQEPFALPCQEDTYECVRQHREY